jgi:hypothetical protein
MDASPDVLAEQVRLKRSAIDNDLELLRVRLQKNRPTRDDAIRWARRAAPVIAGTAALWLWRKRRHGVNSLHQLLVHALTDLYQAEQQMVPALRRLEERASDPDLKKALTAHVFETGVHIHRLERAFRAIRARPGRRRHADGVAGLIGDSDRLLKSNIDPGVRDAWLIATAQRIEHV